MPASKQSTQFEEMGRFLVEHETCGEGFDVTHPRGDGGGTVAIRCRGCGGTFDYATTTIEIEREIELEPIPVASPPRAEHDDEAPTDELELPTPAVASKPPPSAGRPAGGPPPSKSPPSAPRHGRPAPRPRPRQHPGLTRRERLLSGALLAFALCAVTFAVVRFVSDGGDEPRTVAHQPAAAPAVELEVAGATAARGTANGSSATGRSGAAAGQTGQATEVDGGNGSGNAASPIAPGPAEQLVETDRFSLIVPKSWARGEAEGGLLLAPPGAAPVSLQAFFEENPTLTMAAMIAKTGEFLRSRSAGGSLAEPRRLRVDGAPAFELRKPGPLGSQTALGVLAGPTRYLIVEGVDAGAPSSLVAEADRALRSFRPR